MASFVTWPANAKQKPENSVLEASCIQVKVLS
jgi:hypothetical protein